MYYMYIYAENAENQVGVRRGDGKLEHRWVGVGHNTHTQAAINAHYVCLVTLYAMYVMCVRNMHAQVWVCARGRALLMLLRSVSVGNQLEDMAAHRPKIPPFSVGKAFGIV